MSKKKVLTVDTRVLTVDTRQAVHVKFLQDRSGSMQGGWNETLNGFKVFVNDLKKKDDVKYLFSLVTFDTQIDVPLVAVPIADVDANILAQYPPRGGTALYDALGRTLAGELEMAAVSDKEIVLIVTDGEENASKTWTKDVIHAIVDGKLKEGLTTFQYLGAQPESWSDSAKIGLGGANTVQYDLNNVRNTYMTVADAVNNFSSSSMKSCRSMTASFANGDLLKASNMKFVNPDETVIKP